MSEMSLDQLHHILVVEKYKSKEEAFKALIQRVRSLGVVIFAVTSSEAHKLRNTFYQYRRNLRLYTHNPEELSDIQTSVGFNSITFSLIKGDQQSNEGQTEIPRTNGTDVHQTPESNSGEARHTLHEYEGETRAWRDEQAHC